MAAVDVAAQHLELAGAEQRLQLARVAHRKVGAARHPQRAPLRLEARALGVRQQMPDQVHGRVGRRGHRLPWARVVFGTADFIVQRGPRVAIDAQDVLGVDRAAQRPHLAAQRRGYPFQRQRAAVRVRQRLRHRGSVRSVRRRRLCGLRTEGSRPLRDTQMSGPRCPACCSATTASTALRLVPITQTVASAAMPAASSLTG